MRFGIAALCSLATACGFDARLSPPSDQLVGPDASAKLPDAAIDAAPVKVCAASYVAVPAAQTTSKYRRVQVQTAWQKAVSDCASDGGHLVIAETSAEAIAIHAFVDPLDDSPYYWVGILDPEQDGTWVTITGTPFPSIPWGDNDPDQRDGEIYALVDEDGSYYDWFDDGMQEYACECTP